MILLLSIMMSLAYAEPEAKLEHKLDYSLDSAFLEKGNFQYFYSLLKEENGFVNLFEDQSETPVDQILKTFLPLDTKKEWDSKDGHFLAVAKISYLLPISISGLDEKRLTDTEYLQKTLPRYEVTKRDGYFHVGGSLITPDFDLTVNFLTPDHPYVAAIPLIDPKSLESGKTKVAFMHQKNFGKVIFFKTAKSSNALIIYEEHGPKLTLVTQFILSNIINVPTRDLIRKGMIENLRDVVEGSRAAIKNF